MSGVKIFSVILSLYIFGLIAVPCSDTHGEIAEHATTFDLADHQHQHAEGDLCSPFCFCNCCQTLTPPAQFVDFQFMTIADISLGTFQQLKYSDTQLEFWHPPKL